MKSGGSVPANIDEYIAAFPPEVRSILQRIRTTIRDAAPQAQEKIGYRIPAFSFKGDLIYFAAFKSHIGLYPPVVGDEKLMQAVAPYAGEKGNLRFPLDEAIPYVLIGRIVKARVKERSQRVASRSRGRV